jgi:hypothetical protein
MNVSYCDLCGNPIKHKHFVLTISEYVIVPESNYSPTDSDLTAYYKQSGWAKEKEVEICDTCKSIIDKIFEKRMKGIIKLADDLKTIYDIPAKKRKKKDKDK